MNTETQREAMLELLRLKWLAYELLKQAWLRDHPKARPREYNAACQVFADQLEL